MDTIGRYEVVGRIGSGGFATVYRVHDTVLDSGVAAKVLADNWSDKPDVRTRFIREAQLLRRIDSDRVVTVHDIGELPSGQPYFVMALADGGTLDRRLQQMPPPSDHDIRAIAERLAACVSTVHSHGLIHRDIKPSNLLIAGSRNVQAQVHATETGLLGPNERLILGDFGLAKDLDLQTSVFQTISAGTGGYAAPEQMTPGGVPSHHTDLYAATGVIYRVVTATTPPPFDPVQETVPFPRDEPMLAGRLGAFFRRGMAFDVQGRHQSVEEWLDDFTTALPELSSGSRPAPPTIPNQNRTPTSPTDPSTERQPPPSSDPARGPQWAAETITRPPSLRGVPVVPTDPPAASPPPRSNPVVSQPSPPPRPNPVVSQPTPPPRVNPPRSVPLVESKHQRPPGQAPVRPTAGVPVRRDLDSSVYRDDDSSSGLRWLALLVVVAAAVAGGYFFLTREAGPEIIGPDEVVAGTSAVYEATFEGADQFTWTDANGEEQVSPDLTVDAIVPGSLEFSVVAITDGQESPSTTKTITITANPDPPIIDGPDTVEVGQTVVYTFRAPDDVTNPQWSDPTGEIEFGDNYTVTPNSPGSFRIVLVVTRDDGTKVGTSRQIEFVD